ncbi:recombinase family protein [Massilia sp. AB1]|uniref:recombinase family protein n=1 Tax=Massilia sp. AB1 TaxID=2823371 RepID=UPI001B829224|nr:recombinase family protein [Massilia sp. AB1]MBQ5939867.1 recombinase family protein [Massilia sp. AB1]
MVSSGKPVAVIYVRASKESQDYSTDHQRAKIRAYAAAHTIHIIREYVDDGKSGLDIKRRAGLRALMRDVQVPQPDFTHIIVYDVSRWGRFQDIDEAAYHEHTCRRAGIKVVYCGEQFGEGVGPYASLLKSMKRVMAAEYSRELSEKVFAAQSRFIVKGFKQGGHAGFGLRRLALKACGTPRAILEYGESKVCATDRIVLVWGPDHEVATVRRVYSLYLNTGASEAGLARLLNSENVPTEFGRPWTKAMINSLLTNVKYCGALVYNRRSCRLSTPRIRNSPDEWIVNPTAVEPIVVRKVFDEVQIERARRRQKYPPSELIEQLRQCYQNHGRVNAKIIAADTSMPDPQLFVRTFGSLIRAYEAAGLPRSHKHIFVETKRKLLAERTALIMEVEKLARSAGATCERTTTPFTLLLNDHLLLRLEMAVSRNPSRGLRNWRMHITPGADFTIFARMSPVSLEVLDYFLMPAADRSAGSIYLKATNLDQYAAKRFSCLADMFMDIGATHEVAKC